MATLQRLWARPRRVLGPVARDAVARLVKAVQFLGVHVQQLPRGWHASIALDGHSVLQGGQSGNAIALAGARHGAPGQAYALGNARIGQAINFSNQIGSTFGRRRGGSNQCGQSLRILLR